jgi:hypothetical protein
MSRKYFAEFGTIQPHNLLFFCDFHESFFAGKPQTSESTQDAGKYQKNGYFWRERTVRESAMKSTIIFSAIHTNAIIEHNRYEW